MVADCPETKSKSSISKKPYKKMALKATWESENETDEEVDTAYVCFMANDNTPKVASEPSLDDCELTMMSWVRHLKSCQTTIIFLKRSI